MKRKNSVLAVLVAGSIAAGVPAASALAVGRISNIQRQPSHAYQAPPNTVSTGSVRCPADTKVVSAGTVLSQTDAVRNILFSYPQTNRVWQVRVASNGTATGTFAVFAICAVVRGYTVNHATAAATPGGQSTVTVACPEGKVPLGGGGGISEPDSQASINSSSPLASGWQVKVNNPGSIARTAEAYVVCGGPPPGYQVKSGPVQTVAPHTNLSTRVYCPSGTKTLGGGSISTSTSVLSGQSESRYVSNDWEAAQNNGSDQPDTIQAQVICGQVAT